MRISRPRADVIAHPIRLRILGVLAGRKLTTEEIGKYLEDVPLPTLYRHLALLIEGGQVLEVESSVNKGKATRVLSLPKGAAVLDQTKSHPKSREENTQMVNTFLTTLMATYATAVRDPDVTPGDWTLKGVRVWVNQSEEEELMTLMRQRLETLSRNPKTPDGRRRAIIIGSLPDREIINQIEEMGE